MKHEEVAVFNLVMVTSFHPYPWITRIYISCRRVLLFRRQRQLPDRGRSNASNQNGNQNIINLEAGTYTLTAVDNDTNDPNGLPSIKGTITIRQNDHLATIQRDPDAPPFRLFHVAPSGDLRLYGLGLRNGLNDLVNDLSQRRRCDLQPGKSFIGTVGRISKS